MNAKELGERLHAKRVEWQTLWNSKADKTFADDEINTLTQLNTEMTDLGKKYEVAKTNEETAARTEREIKEYTTPVNRLEMASAGERQAEVKSLRQILRDSQEYGAFRLGQTKTAVVHLPVETAAHELGIKTLMTLTTINNVSTRLPGPRVSAQEERTTADLMLQGQTDNNTLTYLEETTFTNAAAAVAEGGTKPESALAFTERTESVRKIATWIPATDELLSDVSGIESYIRGRLGFMVERHLESQILTGDGTAPNISGILDRSTIQTEAKGANPTPDAIYRAMTKVRNTGFAEPTAVVFHPNDWQDVKLLRTADGMYIWGNPASEAPDRIWGLEVRVTTAMTENTALVGAFRPFAQLFMRQGVTITISTEHSTYFVENKVAILAELRAALAVYRPAAFCTVTGI